MFEHRQQMTWPMRLARINWLGVGLVLALAVVGTATLYSVAGGAFEPWAARHGLRCLAGLCLLVAVAMVPIGSWMAFALPIYVLALALLLAVPIFGNEVMGAKRWIVIAGVSVQPSELMKVALVLMLAWFYATLPSDRVSRPQWVAVALVIIAVPMGLTLRQPDLGSAILFGALGVGIMFLAGVSVWYFAVGAVSVFAVLPNLISHLHDYQRRRIEVFLDPTADPLGAGYHIAQARIALGAGGWSGQGYLKGTQNQLDFVPEKMTDFVFVMIGEEWGFIGACGVLALYAGLIGTLFLMAASARTAFARLVIAGASLSVSVYVVINVGMVTGLSPVVGVPLPFLSYGGSAMLALMAALGVAMSAHIHDGRQ